jgi:hypothetical protein
MNGDLRITWALYVLVNVLAFLLSFFRLFTLVNGMIAKEKLIKFMGRRDQRPSVNHNVSVDVGGSRVNRENIRNCC